MSVCTSSAHAPALRPAGDEEQRREALGAAITTDSPRLHALARRMLGEHHAAEDAVQDACLRALQALDRFRGDASMGTWLYRITANVCLDELRRRRRLVVQAETGGEGEHRAVEVDFTDAVLGGAHVADALAALPRALRAALVLTDVWGFNYADASAVLGVPVGTLGSRVHRARASMRANLEPALDVAA
jgi:RNA polymerase sigma-70 factor, ECF subfamily